MQVAVVSVISNAAKSSLHAYFEGVNLPLNKALPKGAEFLNGPLGNIMRQFLLVKTQVESMLFLSSTTLLDGCNSACQRHPRLLRTTGLCFLGLRQGIPLMNVWPRARIFQHISWKGGNAGHRSIVHGSILTSFVLLRVFIFANLTLKMMLAYNDGDIVATIKLGILLHDDTRDRFSCLLGSDNKYDNQQLLVYIMERYVNMQGTYFVKHLRGAVGTRFKSWPAAIKIMVELDGDTFIHKNMPECQVFWETATECIFEFVDKSDGSNNK